MLHNAAIHSIVYTNRLCAALYTVGVLQYYFVCVKTPDYPGTKLDKDIKKKHTKSKYNEKTIR